MRDGPAKFVDALQVRRGFTRAARTYDRVAVLQREVATRMLGRLDYVRIEPQRIVDLGCGTGASLTALHERYARALLTGIDSCEAMLRVGQTQRSRLRWLLPFLGSNRVPLIVADAMALPVRSGSIGLVWSNLMLHWVEDARLVLREANRVLETGGLLMFSTLGPDTLRELRSVFPDGYAHTLSFTDMHDYGDLLLECGFADPVMDAEWLTLTYGSFDELLADLRQSGSSSPMHARRRGLTGRRTWAAARTAYQALARDGRLPATIEVVYGHAWKVQPRTIPDGRAIVRFERSKR